MRPAKVNILWGLKYGALCAFAFAMGATAALIQAPGSFAAIHSSHLKLLLGVTAVCLLGGAVVGLFRRLADSLLEYLFVAGLACLFGVSSVLLLVDGFSDSSVAVTVLFGLLLGFRIWFVRRRSSTRVV